MRVDDYSRLSIVADASQFFEIRMENDVDGNPIYIGYTNQPNALTSALVWFIIKITYDAGGSPTLQELPNNGVVFEYAWDNRATYF